MQIEPSDFRRVVELTASLDVVVADDERRAALRSVLEAAVALLPEGGPAVLAGIPRMFGEAMGPFGWAWNGYYVRRSPEAGELHLASAFGPPVCSQLDASGGPLTSGMCFDALHLNQVLAAFDTKAWPGYVSCDVASGLGTVSGIVCPIRDAAGTPFAVWDLDATQRIDPGDVRFADAFFSTLCRTFPLSAADLG